ncbi:trimeric intracellular cation channel family protein [Nesterenkonia populi]|uniref:trimeric intracellular cation channel family protein n=1 Tax=Nesterenkonia populi TaxID=1591087 RepID=UPI0011BE5F5D|nr:TRIC cation channel family protein [Nesterenkonia populi]
MPLAEVLLVLELIGTFAFAVSGALLAAKKGVDIVGSLLLASLAGLGGGVIRDLVLSDAVPTAFAHPYYLIPVVVAVTAVYVRAIREDRLRRTLLVFDAVGLSVFCVMGTSIAHAAGLNPVAAALLGLTTAVGGGTLRDVVANEVPEIFNPKGVYAVPAMVGSAAAVIALELGVFNSFAAVGVAAAVFLFRLVALRRGWTVPLAAHGTLPGGRSD